MIPGIGKTNGGCIMHKERDITDDFNGFIGSGGGFVDAWGF